MKFKIGDRVKYIYNDDNLKNKIGVIRYINFNDYDVEFEDWNKGHKGYFLEGPKNNHWECDEDDLELFESKNDSDKPYDFPMFDVGVLTENKGKVEYENDISTMIIKNKKEESNMGYEEVKTFNKKNLVEARKQEEISKHSNEVLRARYLYEELTNQKEKLERNIKLKQTELDEINDKLKIFDDTKEK